MFQFSLKKSVCWWIVILPEFECPMLSIYFELQSLIKQTYDFILNFFFYEFTLKNLIAKYSALGVEIGINNKIIFTHLIHDKL